MQIILLEKVVNVGNLGDVVKVPHPSVAQRHLVLDVERRAARAAY